MTVLRLGTRGLGISPRRRAAPDAGSGPPGDTAAPTVPQNLSATAISEDRIDLTWDASSDNVGVTGYNIYRDNVLIGTSPTNSYSDTGLDDATEYAYEVSALDGAGNDSGRSGPDTATTADATAPSVPQNLVAAAISDGQIDLTWDAATDNVAVDHYNIYRDDVLIDTSPTNAYSDAGVAIETGYEYEVSAVDAEGNQSARSDPDSATTAVSRLSPEFVGRAGFGVQSDSSNNVGYTYATEDVRADDLFVAMVAVNDRGAAPTISTTASGWTYITTVINSELAFAVFYKRATGSETGTETPFDWGAGDGSNDVAMCQVYRWRYVDWTHGGPFFGSPVTVTGNLTSITMPTVATQGSNGLALALMAFSDDLSGSLGPTVASTGGTWIAPRDREQTTSADDLAITAFQAPLAAAGTISGGSLAITPTSPHHSRSIAIGLALRGMVDPANYSTISVSIAASADDAREAISTTTVNTNSTTLFLSGNNPGMRFTGLSALAGKTIVQANIQVTCSATQGSPNDGVIQIKGEAADSAAQYAASNGNISGRSLTTASRNWTVPIWITDARTIRQRSVDVRSIVQEITDRPGFGGVVNFIWSLASGNSRQWASYDHSTLTEASLTVRYLP